MKDVLNIYFFILISHLVNCGLHSLKKNENILKNVFKITNCFFNF
jgi:hypothetical protein